MSQPANPYNRPLPPEIYRRRRIAAGVGLLVIVVVLVLIVRAVAGGGGSDSGTTAETSTSSNATLHRTAAASTSTTASGASSASAAASTSASGKTTEHRSTGASGTEKTSTTAEPGAQCSLGDLTLSVQAGAPTYAAGAAPDFYLTVANPTQADCTVSLADHPMSFEVFTLTDYTRIWADTDCNAPTSEETLDLAPGASRNFALNGWSRTTSAPGQCTDRADAGTGAFLLYGHIGDQTSEPATFNLA